jgi:type I restriction enzyme S subunit
MAEKHTNPEVRFSGYSEDWEERELGKILTQRNVLQKISVDAPILAFAAGQGVIDRSERKSNNRDHLTHDQENKIYKLTELNDIVYNPSNLKYGAIDRNRHGRGVISPIYVTFTTEEEPSFVELIVKSEKFKLRALQYEEGTVVKRQSVKPENLLSLKVNISRSKDEQKQIGSLFAQLDNLIEHHQNKYNKLVVIKKAMLEKIFPKCEENIPEIRFKQFQSTWIPTKFKKIADVRRGLTYSPTNLSNSGIRVLRSSNIYQDQFILKADDVFVNENSVNIELVKDNDILITSANGSSRLVGKHAVINNFKGKTAHGGFMLLATTKHPHFLNASMSTSWYARFVNLYTAGGGGSIGNLSKSDLEEQVIFVPIEDEQKVIGNFFNNIDQLIAQHKIQLSKLKNLKTACFEKMTSSTSKHFA